MSRWALVLVLALLAAPASAKKEQTAVQNDDRSLIPLSEGFGFGPDGQLLIELSGIQVYSLVVKRKDAKKDAKDVNWDNFGFFLSTIDQEAALEEDMTMEKCPLEKKDTVLFRFTEPGVQNVIYGKAYNYTRHFTLTTGSYYYLYFANCEPETPISFWADLEMYNVGPSGGKDYLSVGETELDTVYWIMFGLFAACSLGWVGLCWKSKDVATQVHALMLALVVCKSLTCLSQALMYHYIEVQGTADGWNVAYYIFTFFRGLLFFTVVVLVGTGWNYMKPFVGDREKRILLVVIPLQVINNIAIIVTDVENPADRSWFTWRDVLHLVDIICCCAVLFPIVWSIKHLREASQADGKAARNLEKLQLFRQFYLTVVMYIYFTRIVVYLLKNTLDYQYTWLGNAAEELATLAFYVWVGINFRPHKENQYLRLEQDEIEL